MTKLTPAASQPSATRAPAGEEHPHRYTAALANQIEPRWQAVWESRGDFAAPNPGDPAFDPARPKFYCLDMFPYPSGAGLHVGHPEGYTATDILCRYRRMKGFNVLHPMGWDAFGLPAEQYAIQTGIHPAQTTRKSIDTFRRQLKRFGFSYDWSREFATIDEEYYRWTQWVFLRIYDAWYDAERDRARPMVELVAELEAGSRPPRINPDAAEFSAAARLRAFGPWRSLSAIDRRAVIDSHRLAYLAEQTVNWCPKLGTALANEEVIDGRSERGGYPVYRKPLRQWMFRITAYAERLLRDLDLVEWPESTRLQQTEWIGRSEGAEIEFPLPSDREVSRLDSLRVFTTRPDTIFGATFMVIAPEHPLVDAVLDDDRVDSPRRAALRAYVEAARNRSDVDRVAETKTKTGVFTGVHCLNPATGQPIPVWTADYVLMGYGTGAIMAVPGQDQRDWDFARAFNLPIIRTVQPPDEWPGEAYLGDGPAINSAGAEVSLNGLSIPDAKSRIIDWLERTGRGERRINYKLRDWLFSRQRYWGEPFPIVFDAAENHYPIDPSNLPVVLPPMADYQPVVSDEPQPLLAKAASWVNTTAGAAGVAPGVLAPSTPVHRETNTMPGWAGSCWYYLRYCDPRNGERFVGRDAERYWMVSPKRDGTPHAGGVDLYIGGAEHAVLHLLYARFWHKVLFDLGEVSMPEPFGRLFHQGLITSFAYQRADKTLVAVDEVEPRGEGAFIERSTGAAVTQVAAKMSKSLKNVVNPDDVIAEFGADTFRLYEMYMGPLEASKPWNPRDIGGLFRFLQRAWRLAVNEQTGEPLIAGSRVDALERALHRTIARVADDIERLAFNTAIAALIEFVNAATASAPGNNPGNRPGSGSGSASAAGAVLTRDQLERFALVLAPFVPHLAEELWSRLGRAEPLAHSPWPAVEASLLRDDTIELPVQVMGKVKARINVPADADEHAIRAAALADDRIRAAIEGKPVRKLIIVPGKIVNIIVG
jgi:leucyl-tRNA synthetase